MTLPEPPPTGGAEVITDAVLATAATEGVPPWLTYVGGAAGTLIVAPLVGVAVKALAKRWGVDATSSPTSTPTQDGPSTPPPDPDEDDAELEELRAALSDLLVELRQTKARAAAAERQVETLQGLLETMAGRHHAPPRPPS